MPIPCCEYCYEKYIKPDRSIEPKFIENVFGNDSTLEHRKEPNSYTRDNLPLIDRVYVVNGKKEKLLCTCECHVQGITCLH